MGEIPPPEYFPRNTLVEIFREVVRDEWADVLRHMVMWAKNCTVSPDCVTQRVAARFIQRDYMRHSSIVTGIVTRKTYEVMPEKNQRGRDLA